MDEELSVLIGTRLELIEQDDLLGTFTLTFKTDGGKLLRVLVNTYCGDAAMEIVKQ
ncbi:MAG: hypothetical protein WA584_23460 [Pyrinomonadaceae bacterium]